MAEPAKRGSGGDHVSLQTLVIAAAASATSAIVISHLWTKGTVVAAAMTPVIVAIVKDLLARPMESELVKKPVQQVSRIASSTRRATAGAGSARTRSIEDEFPPTEHDIRPDPGSSNGDASHGDPLVSPIRTYGRSRRRLHPKVILVTGLLAFLIAAAALTLPELLFGGAVSSHHSTTLFGGGSKSQKDKQEQNDSNGGTNQQDQSKPESGSTTPATPPSASGEDTQPSTTTAAPTQPQEQPPAQTTPVPTTPAPASP